MKKLEKYRCDICYTEFADEKECRECEENHYKKIRIKDKRYVRTEKFPVSITIVTEDGSTRIYR